MEIKKGAGAIIFRENEKGEKEYLVLHRVKNWQGYEFVKGGIEKGENVEEAVKREIVEETGIKSFEIVKKIDKRIEWQKNNKKYDYEFFLVKAKDNNIKVDEKEHDNYEWVNKEEALKKITYKDIKELLEKEE